jgi:hypothetical protein
MRGEKPSYLDFSFEMEDATQARNRKRLTTED